MQAQFRNDVRMLAAVIFVIADAISPASATTRTWPLLDCNGTLQACIDAANPGDTVLIGNDEIVSPDSYTAVDEDISINKSLTLQAMDGIDAVFAADRSITVNSPGSGATSVTLRRLVLQRGHVVFDHFSDTASSYFADNLRVSETDAVSNCAIQFYDFGSGSPQFTVGNSTIELNHSGSGACALFAQGNGGPWQGAFSGNRVRAANGSASGNALIRVLGTSSGTFRIASNQLVGSGFAGGIDVWQQTGSAANTWYIDDNVITGEVVPPTSGFAGIFVTPQNSELHVVNNTVAHGTQGLWIRGPSSSPDSSSGQIANNLVAFQSGAGLSIASIAALGNRNNLVYANGSDFFTTGPGTVTSDPQLVGPRNLRVHATSPARDQGNSADVPAFTFDADGERRIIGSAVDIGAFEYNLDRGLVHTSTAAEACCNSSQIDSGEFLAVGDGIGPDETLLLTPHHGDGNALQLAQNLGSWLVSAVPPTWALFHENTSVTMQPGRAFSVFAPTYGYGKFVHTTTAGTIASNYTKLPALDGGVSAIAFVTHNWNPGGGNGTYHDHRIGLERFGSDWYIRNEDATVDMPVGVSFNVVVAPFFASANAWQVIVPGAATARMTLSHPRLDDNPCAAPQVTRVDDPSNPAVVSDDVPFGVAYVAGYAGAPGHWFIVAEGAGTPTFPAGAGFNVMVPGAQADVCRDNDRIFADGFDA